MKKALASVAVVAIIGVAAYFRSDYSQARNSLSNAQLGVTTTEEKVRSVEKEPTAEAVSLAKERFRLADGNVKFLETSNSLWLSKDDVSELRKRLDAARSRIDALTGSGS